MATIAEVMSALAAQLRTELQPHTDIPLHIEDRAFLAGETPRIDMIVTSSTALEAGMYGFGDLTDVIPITLRAVVSVADADAGENLLLAFMDDEDDLSVIKAIDADHTVGGTCQDIWWDQNSFPWTGYTDFTDINANGFYLGSALQLALKKVAA